MDTTVLPDEFEPQLRLVVTAKRLSGSKMAALTELAMANMQSDTQMISLMYRLHKTLPAANKVSSLYVFDSVARAAHRHKAKKALVADLNSAIGNAASFLVRLEGVLGGLVEDMLAHGPPEAKEKTRKVLDIWTREGTFPAGLLARLSERVKQGDQSYSQGTTDNRAPPAINTAVPQTLTAPPLTTTPNGIASLPPAILALLGGTVPTTPAVAQPASPSVAVSPPAPPTQSFTLDPTQLALINQLTAQAAPVASIAPAHSPPHLSEPGRRYSSDAGTGNGGFHSPRSRSRSRSRSPGRWREARFRDRDRYRDGDRTPRGGGRHRERERDRGGAPPRLRGRDGHTAGHAPRPRRSRSPGWDRDRDRDRHSSGAGAGEGTGGSGRAPLPGAGEQGKDEFGRDIRDGDVGGAASPSAEVLERDRGATAHSTPVSVSAPMPEPEAPGFSPARPAFSSAAPAFSPTASGLNSAVAAFSPTAQAGSGGLAAFDLSTFDFTNPESWAKLASAWEHTYGRSPTQEELMAFISGGGAPGPGGSVGGGGMGDGAQWGQAQSGWRGRGRGGGFRGRGRGRGRGGGGGGGGGYGGYGGGSGGYGSGFGQDAGGASDAIVLGGGDDDSAGGYQTHAHPEQNGDGFGYDAGMVNGNYGAMAPDPAPTSNTGGGMKKIDGKWVWTKN